MTDLVTDNEKRAAPNLTDTVTDKPKTEPNPHLIDPVTANAKTLLGGLLSESVTDREKKPPMPHLTDHVTDEAKIPPLKSIVLTGGWRSPLRAMHRAVFDSAVTLEAVLTMLETRHHAEQEQSVTEWRKRVEQALSGDERSIAVVALFGGPDKVLTPKPWTFKFNRHRFVHRGICWECRTEFVALNTATLICSDACERERNLRNMRHWRLMREKPDRPDSVCRHCGVAFAPTRSDAVFCSTRCRVASHRLKRKPTAEDAHQDAN